MIYLGTARRRAAASHTEQFFQFVAMLAVLLILLIVVVNLTVLCVGLRLVLRLPQV